MSTPMGECGEGAEDRGTEERMAERWSPNARRMEACGQGTKDWRADWELGGAEGAKRK